MADTAQTSAEILTGWNDRLTALADSITAAAKTHGLEVVDAALGVARVSASQGLIIGFGLLAGAILGAVVARRLFQKARVVAAAHKGYGDPEFPYVFGGAMASLATVVVSIFAGICLLDVWSWVGLIEPKLYIAHKLLKL